MQGGGGVIIGGPWGNKETTGGRRKSPNLYQVIRRTTRKKKKGEKKLLTNLENGTRHEKSYANGGINQEIGNPSRELHQVQRKQKGTRCLAVPARTKYGKRGGPRQKKRVLKEEENLTKSMLGYWGTHLPLQKKNQGQIKWSLKRGMLGWA